MVSRTFSKLYTSHILFLPPKSFVMTKQGELMNRIENHVQEAEEYVDSAKTDTKKAIRYQSKARLVSTCVE